jgi:hypothetical protein
MYILEHNKVFKEEKNQNNMKKGILLPVLVLLVLSVVSMVSAKTIVAGKIYNADFSDVVGNASVVVKCNTEMGNAFSLADGTYAVAFNETECNGGETVIVSASKGDLTGSATGDVSDNVVLDLDIAIVNVPLVPEFGMIVGFATVLSAIAVFFMIRRA